MNDIFEILDKLHAEEKQEFLDMIAYCDSRITADDGIPAIIALDDLTAESSAGGFEPAPADRDIGLVMATDALLYTNLYEQRADKNGKYPAICPAMSAVAETCFRAEYAPGCDDFTLVPYREVVGAFLKKGEA